MSEINPLYEDLFWKKVNKTEGGCWNWTASKRCKGYGAGKENRHREMLYYSPHCLTRELPLFEGRE